MPGTSRTWWTSASGRRARRVHPGSARSASTRSLPSGPLGNGRCPRRSVRREAGWWWRPRRQRCARGVRRRRAGERGWFSGLTRQSQPESVWPTATRPGTASIRLAVSWAAVSVDAEDHESDAQPLELGPRVDALAGDESGDRGAQGGGDFVILADRFAARDRPGCRGQRRWWRARQGLCRHRASARRS